MPAGALVIGHAHREETFNILLAGVIRVKIDGVIHELKAPCIIKSSAGTRKIAYVIEETRWVNVHATKETNLAVLEDTLIEKSAMFKAHENTLEAMTSHTLQEKATA